jgi:hypothetical protein
LRQGVADAADDLILVGLSGSPSEGFPFAHLRDADDWNRHGTSVASFKAA